MNSRAEDQPCGVCEPKHLERNKYYYGKQFTVRDMQQEQLYFLQRMALTNRALFGWGVVCGLDVELGDTSLVVHQGLAMDCCGHQILVCEEVTVCMKALAAECPGQDFALCLEYAECETEEIKLPPDGCDISCSQEHNRIRDHYRIRLVPWKNECHDRRDNSLPCPDSEKRPVAETPKPGCTPPSLHRHLCHHLQCLNCECCACVVLAKVTVGDNPTSDPCTHRRIVYNNPMLFKLLECYHGDLSHIVDFNWREKTREKKNRYVPWAWFFGQIKDGLKVYFDRHMDPKSLSRHTFIVTLTFADADSGRIRAERVPSEKRPFVEIVGECSNATFQGSASWLDDDTNITALRDGFDVEITLRGSNIYTDDSDHRPRKALDGDFIGELLPTGNGTPGGDFFDWFHVEAQPHTPQPVPQDEED